MVYYLNGVTISTADTQRCIKSMKILKKKNFSMVYYLNGVTISTADTQICIKSKKILKKTPQWFIIWMALPFPLLIHKDV